MITASNHLLAKQAITRQELPCYQWQPSAVLIKEAKTGNCHKRYLGREKERKKGGMATYSTF